MAIILLGKTRCAICGKVLHASEQMVAFPALFPNQADPLHLFDDAAVHQSCLNDHPLRQLAEERVTEYRQKTGPGTRYCRVCGREVLDPDDYIGFGHLTDDPTSPLNRHNYLHLHPSCFRDWPEAKHVLSLLKTMLETRKWCGDGLPALIKDLETLLDAGQ